MSLCWDVLIGPRLMTSQAGTSPLYMALDFLWNIPIEAAYISDSWTRGSGKNTKVMLVDLLEWKSGIISSEIPTVILGSVMPLNPAVARVLKVSEVITIAVDNNRHTQNTIPWVRDLIVDIPHMILVKAKVKNLIPAIRLRIRLRRPIFFCYAYCCFEL